MRTNFARSSFPLSKALLYNLKLLERIETIVDSLVEGRKVDAILTYGRMVRARVFPDLLALGKL